MPTPPPLLDSVYSVLNAAKVRLNDAIPSLQAVSGKLLANNSEFSQQVVNNAWRRLQEYCANRGLTILKQEAIIPQFPVAGSADPANFSWLDWTGCNDGQTTYTTPYLPGDLILPYKVWERASNLAGAFPREPLELFVDGLPTFAAQIFNRCWEWRASRIYIPGALQQVDFRILYARYLGDFLDVGTTQWFQQLVPIPRSQDALSLYICAEIAQARSDMNETDWTEKAEAAARQLCNRDVSMKQRGTFRKRSRSGRLEMGSVSSW